MKRDYETGEATDVIFFTGREVEKTPAYGKKTVNASTFFDNLFEVEDVQEEDFEDELDEGKLEELEDEQLL